MISTLDSNQHWKSLPKKNPTALHQHPPKVALSEWTCSLPIKLYSDVFTSCIYIYWSKSEQDQVERASFAHAPQAPFRLHTPQWRTEQTNSLHPNSRRECEGRQINTRRTCHDWTDISVVSGYTCELWSAMYIIVYIYTYAWCYCINFQWIHTNHKRKETMYYNVHVRLTHGFESSTPISHMHPTK